MKTVKAHRFRMIWVASCFDSIFSITTYYNHCEGITRSCLGYCPPLRSASESLSLLQNNMQRSGPRGRRCAVFEHQYDWTLLLLLLLYYYIHIYIYTYTHIITHTHIDTYMHACIHTHTHIYIYIYTYVCIYIYTYIYIYIHIYIYAYAHLCLYERLDAKHRGFSIARLRFGGVPLEFMRFPSFFCIALAILSCTKACTV